MSCDIIVVDDYSSQPVVVDGAKVIRNQRRLGVGESRNVGCRAAAPGWLMFMDDDVIPSTGLASFVREVLPRLDRKDVVGFRIVGHNTMGSRTIEYRDTTLRRVLNILFGVDTSPKTGLSKFIPAPVMMFHSEFYASLGGSDSRTYGGNGFRESSDLQLRARKMGGAVIYFEDPFFTHINIPGGHEKRHSENDTYYMRNQTIFAIRRGSPISLVMIAGFGIYMLFKGFRISSLVRGIAQGLSVAVQD